MLKNVGLGLGLIAFLHLHGADTPGVDDAQDEKDWISHQVLKDEIISNPAAVAKNKDAIEKLRQHKKSQQAKFALFTHHDSLQKIKHQAMYLHSLVNGFAKKSWMPKTPINDALATTSKLEQSVSGYLHHPDLIDKELKDLSVPAVRRRVEQLAKLWYEALKQRSEERSVGKE